MEAGILRRQRPELSPAAALAQQGTSSSYGAVGFGPVVPTISLPVVRRALQASAFSATSIYSLLEPPIAGRPAVSPRLWAAFPQCGDASVQASGRRNLNLQLEDAAIPPFDLMHISARPSRRDAALSHCPSGSKRDNVRTSNQPLAELLSEANFLCGAGRPWLCQAGAVLKSTARRI
jgi:hypothetical protein